MRLRGGCGLAAVCKAAGHRRQLRGQHVHRLRPHVRQPGGPAGAAPPAACAAGNFLLHPSAVPQSWFRSNLPSGLIRTSEIQSVCSCARCCRQHESAMSCTSQAALWLANMPPPPPRGDACARPASLTRLSALQLRLHNSSLPESGADRRAAAEAQHSRIRLDFVSRASLTAKVTNYIVVRPTEAGRALVGLLSSLSTRTKLSQFASSQDDRFKVRTQ